MTKEKELTVEEVATVIINKLMKCSKKELALAIMVLSERTSMFINNSVDNVEYSINEAKRLLK